MADENTLVKQMVKFIYVRENRFKIQWFYLHTVLLSPKHFKLIFCLKPVTTMFECILHNFL